MDLSSFGRYRLTRRISLGGMAEVFKAKSYAASGFQKVVALKRLLPNVAENEDFVQMFIQEARLASHLDHPNICPIYELGKVAESYYLTMEFVYGHDLRQVLKGLKHRGERADPWVVAWIAAKVSDALDYAYRFQPAGSGPLRVVHRDISPQNVMVGFDGAVKVIDYGIAKAASTTIQTAAGVLKGKYAYMSPEHAQGHVLDARSDIWSLGVVLHEVLSGRRLFVGAGMADTVDQVLHLPVPPLTGIPDTLARIVARMLDRDLDRRYASHDAVLCDIERFLGTAPEPVSSRTVAEWMAELFPADTREDDLTEEDVRLLFSAEELGEETTDVHGDASNATKIFLLDTTGQADYRAVLEKLLAQGRVNTQTGLAAVPRPSPPPADPLAPATRQEAERTLWQAFFAAMGLVALTWLLLSL